MRTLALSVSFALAVPALASAQAPVEKSEPRFSLSLERVASANAVFFRLNEDDDKFKLRTKGVTVGGPISNPLSAPRVGFDYLTSSGWTLGAGLAFGMGDLDSDEGGWRDEGGYNLIMLAPRVGYRVKLADWFDLTPRVGATLGYASISSGEYEQCDYDYETDEESCSQVDGDKVKLFAAAVNLELLGTFRVTDSFNILAGLSYDMLVAAKAKEEYEGYDGDSDSDSANFRDAHLSSLQLWVGMGGYF